MKPIACFTNALLLLAGLSVCSTALAQSARRVYHPGETLVITITFDGPDADKISGAQINLTTDSKEEGFIADIFPGDSQQVRPKTFQMSYKIPLNQSTGDYKLGQIRSILDREAPVTFFYTAPGDFNAKTYRIENPRQVTKPTIRDVN